jgi:hypothetical protein
VPAARVEVIRCGWQPAAERCLFDMYTAPVSNQRSLAS